VYLDEVSIGKLIEFDESRQSSEAHRVLPLRPFFLLFKQTQ